ncbi:MAG: TetR/AcrR family transcriptional regulator [Anaerolineae bacterium]|nr:TetR/AcrR family transcriptional regulator [Anaerolineae bacterium]
MQNTEVLEDLRIRRTRKMIQEALLELSVEKGYPNITVQDIADRAMVNRSTFYRHYLDKDDLLTQYMDEVTALTAEDDDAVDRTPPGKKEVPTGLIKLLRHIAQHSDFYRVMLSEHGHPIVTDRLRRNAEDRFRYLLTHPGIVPTPAKSPLDMRLTYISCAGIGAISWWVENNMPCSAEELAIWVGDLSTASLGFSLRRPALPVKTDTNS